MQRVVLRVNNTQKQYVRLSVAKDVEIWSTSKLKEGKEIIIF